MALVGHPGHLGLGDFFPAHIILPLVRLSPGQSLRASSDPGFWLLEVSCIYQQASLSQCPRGLFLHSAFTAGRHADDTGSSSIRFCPGLVHQTLP